MATRKVKHQRAMEKRELFFLTVKQGNQNWLQQEQSRRLAEKKKAEEARMERKKAKSRALAKAHQTRPQAPGGTAINAQYADERRRA